MQFSRIIGAGVLFVFVSGALVSVTVKLCRAQSAIEEQIVVTGEEVPSAYGAPPGISRTRFSPLITAYVLPPGAVYAGLIYEGDAFRHGPPDHLFTEEIEVGLPYRFGVAFEIAQERFNGDFQNKSFSVEARYALADWNKIPLNPTLFAEYKFGTGRILHEERPPEQAMAEEELARSARLNLEPLDEEQMQEEGKPKMPDAYEFRLLLAEDFGERVEWAMNWFFEQEIGFDRGREWGFAQSAVIPIWLEHERLKTGVEMQYRNFTDKDTRADPLHSFVVGPTIAWKPTHNTRVDVSPLFGCTDDSPRAQVFVVFSILFGPGGETGAEAPASTRNR
ncbi:MAG TPA: hypothetical protein DIT76_05515 [Spartobacteria bacterium]|jgi:hypothetical protein|nr:hypothetical protein [Spartobacteria bacterium]